MPSKTGTGSPGRSRWGNLAEEKKDRSSRAVIASSSHHIHAAQVRRLTGPGGFYPGDGLPA